VALAGDAAAAAVGIDSQLNLPMRHIFIIVSNQIGGPSPGQLEPRKRDVDLDGHGIQ
jgi:hypothetical protein